MQKENRVLSFTTFITSFGDWLSYFAWVVFLYKQSGSVAIAAYSVPLRSLAVGVGGWTGPYLMRFLSLRQILVGTQLVSAAILFFFAIAMGMGHAVSPAVALGLVFFSTAMKQYFEMARETYSQGLGEVGHQRSLQAEILQGLYSAQFLGPLFALGFLQIVPMGWIFVLDGTSFLISASLCASLRGDRRAETVRASSLRPLGYLRRYPGLLQIFLIRSMGYWIPISLFNYLLFSVVTDHYGLPVEHSAIIYALTGLGSLVAAVNLRAGRSRAARWAATLSDAKLAFLALAVLAVTRFLLIELPHFAWALLVLFISGLCNGVNAVTTQSLRRKLATPEQFPEVVGLELLVGKFFDWGVGTLAAAALLNHWLTYQSGMWLSAALTLALAFLHLSARLRRV
ncbi:MAG: hypothetical protein AB7P04_11790 [Bacteriovoracia bacterium]